jgi:RNA-directed DNA polymerase
MEGGLVSPTEEGTPQGGPLSPLLSNLMLDVLDKELEKRGHRFVRYADDCNIYVRSQRAGERVMAGIEKLLAKRLKLKMNKAKSAVAKPSVRKFLGFSFTGGKESPRRRIAPQAVGRFKTKVRELTRRTRGRSLTQIIKELSTYLIGWRGYFGFCQQLPIARICHLAYTAIRRREGTDPWSVGTTSARPSGPHARSRTAPFFAMTLACPLILRVCSP